MSLGWSCESAILPRKARPIDIDNSSFVGLQKLVSDKEKNIVKNVNNFSDIRKEKAASKKLRNDKQKNELGGRKNNRSETDEREIQAAKALAAKAILYEDIMKGKVNGKSSLINFEEKAPVVEPVSTKPTVNKVIEAPIMIDEHSTLQQLYPWSTGQINYNEEYISEQAAERTLRQTIEDRIKAEGGNIDLCYTNSSSSSSSKDKDKSSKSKDTSVGGISEAARIKTQWEQTLNNSARAYIDEIHQETVEARKRQKETEEVLQEIKRRKLQQQEDEEKQRES